MLVRLRTKCRSWWLAYKIRAALVLHGQAPDGFTPEGIARFHSRLSIKHFRGGKEIAHNRREIFDRVVTTAGVNFLVDAFQNITEIETFNWHDSGIGTGSELIGNVGLGSPCGEARDAGVQGEGGAANIYQTVATHTYAGPFAITEHGLFSANAAGTLWDRTVFGAINVVALDQIQFTYQLTCTAGG